MEHNNEIIKELKEIAPVLSRLSKPTVGGVPAAYFQSFPADLIKKIRTQEVADELAEVAPTLSGIEKHNVLTTPATNYFQEAPGLILKKIKDEEKEIASTTPGWLISINVFFESIAGAIFKPRYAAVFAGFATMLLIAVMLVVKIEEQCADIDCRMAQLSNEELNTYFSTHEDEFGSDLLDYSSNGLKDEAEFHQLTTDLTDEEIEKAILY